MLSIKLGNYIADLSKSQLSIVRTSPYPGVAVGNQGGNFIFNFTLPATDELKAALKYAHRPQSGSSVVYEPYHFDAGSGLVFEGMAKVVESSSEEYEIFCPVENGDFNFAAKKIKLNEIELGGDRLLDSDRERVNAKIGYVIDVDQGSEEDFSVETVLPFESISTNNFGELNEAGDTFTSEVETLLSFIFEINPWNNLSNLAEFRLFKNNALVGSKVLNGYYKEIASFDLNAAVGDVFTWHIYIESTWGGYDYRIFFRIYADTSILVSKTISQVLTQAAGSIYPESDFTVFPLENPQAFDSWDDDFYQADNFSIKEIYSKYFKVLNYWKDGIFPYYLTGEVADGENEYKAFKAGNLIVPFPYIAYLIKKILQHFKLRCDVNPFEDQLKRAVLVNHFIENEFLDNDAKLVTSKAGFNLQDHVPEWTVYDFLKHLCNLFGLGYEVDNQRSAIEFHFLDDILTTDDYIDISHLVIGKIRVKPPAVTGIKIEHKPASEDKYFDYVKSLDGLTYKGEIQRWLDLPTGQINDCYFVKQMDSYYAFKYDPDIYAFGWVVYSKNFKQSIVTGKSEGAIEISSDIYPVIMRSPYWLDDVIGAPEWRLWHIPASHQACKFEGAPEMYQTKWMPGVLWYHGMVKDNQENDYPFASPGIKYPDGATIPGMNFSLKLEGETGLYTKKWKRFAEWRINAREVVVPILPDSEFIRTLRFNRKYMIDGVRYIIAEFRCNISSHGPEPGELTMLRL
ncbi:MAG: hypothetical protein CVU46_11155 [Chloroflexi bacterium HGW-Chloroflexi-8]|nr:MAG: hypothetical protein CVU46_11155 [Chloroflexi bacterium HGW-Chloroflexi-8]